MRCVGCSSELKAEGNVPVQNHKSQFPGTNGKVKIIMSLDLSRVSKKLIAPIPEGKGWTPEFTVQAEQLYREFLILAVLHPRKVAPTDIVDDYWHQHILDTEKYHKDCKKIFGTYFHHDPLFGMEGDKQELVDTFNQTNELFLQEFGHLPEVKSYLHGASSGSRCRNCKGGHLYPLDSNGGGSYMDMASSGSRCRNCKGGHVQGYKGDSEGNGSYMD